jgi:hypothetical protein
LATDRPTKFYRSKRCKVKPNTQGKLKKYKNKSSARTNWLAPPTPTFSLVCPPRVTLQALTDELLELVLLRSQIFSELSVDAVTRVSESKNLT